MKEKNREITAPARRIGKTAQNILTDFLLLNAHYIFPINFTALKKENINKFQSSFNFMKIYFRFLDYMGIWAAIMIALHF